MEVLKIALTAVATCFAVVVAIRNRSLTRASFRLHFGVLGLDTKVWQIATRRPKRALVFGLPDRQRDYFVVAIPIGIENTSSLPITSVRVQLEYPTECLVDESKVLDAEHGPYTMGRVSQPGRSVQRLGQIAHVTVDIELLRPGQKVVIYELARIPRSHVPAPTNDQRHRRLERRWRTAPGFFSGFEAQISVWAANCDPLANRVIVAAGHAVSQNDLTALATRLFANVWDDRRPKRGIRGAFARWRRWWTVEFAELILLPSDLLRPGQQQVEFSFLHDAQHALLEFAVPPWGFTGESFDAPGTRNTVHRLPSNDDN